MAIKCSLCKYVYTLKETLAVVYVTKLLLSPFFVQKFDAVQ